MGALPAALVLALSAALVSCGAADGEAVHVAPALAPAGVTSTGRETDPATTAPSPRVASAARVWARTGGTPVQPWFVAMVDLVRLPAVPTRPALLDLQAPRPDVVPPVTVRIPAHGVASTVVPVGVEPASGELAVPADPAHVGWYRFGSSPGTDGAAVLAGHVDWKGRPGAFIDLDRVQPGERIEVDLGDGTTRAFIVTERRLIAKTELPPELFQRRGPARLVLITCGGEYDRSIRRYRQNVVVVATPT